MIKCQISPLFKSLTAKIMALPTSFQEEGVFLYNKRNQIKQFEIEGKSIVVKSFKVPHILNAFVYGNLRESKAKRSFLHANKLIQLGIETPQPIAYIENSRCRMLQNSYYFYEKCPYPNMLYHLREETLDAETQKLLTALAKFTAEMHQKQVFHKDFSPGNILYIQDETGYHFSIIDINRMKFKSVHLKEACYSFRRMWGGEEIITYFAQEYAIARGFDVTKVVSQTLYHHRIFFEKLNRSNNRKK